VGTVRAVLDVVVKRSPFSGARGRLTLSVQSLLITDAAPSFDEQQAHRRRTYSILMVVHIVGFGLSYPLYLWQPWVCVVAVALTGVLPWVAVLLANAPRRAVRKPTGLVMFSRRAHIFDIP
jgi:hypothetical protein